MSNSISNENKRKFRLGFFAKKEGNETLELNGFLLFKHWDGNKKVWTVDLFTPESYLAMKNSKKKQFQEESLF